MKSIDRILNEIKDSFTKDSLKGALKKFRFDVALDVYEEYNKWPRNLELPAFLKTQINQRITNEQWNKWVDKFIKEQLMSPSVVAVMKRLNNR